MLKNISNSSKIIGSLGLITIIIASLTTGPFNLLNSITLIGGLLGFLSVIQIVNRNWWAGVTGFLSALIYIGVAIIAKNPSDAILNILFIFVLDLPIIF